jgi:hypothetical protein
MALLCLASICLALAGLLAFVLAHSAAKERDWTRERQLLITRIQHPEIVIASPEKAEVADAEIRNEELEDQIDLVGTVQVNGNGD